MDYNELYSDLTRKLAAAVPIPAHPTRELVQTFKADIKELTLKSKLTIISVFNTGDISGIMCAVELHEGRIACSLTH